MAESLVVTSKIKDMIKSKGMNTAGDATEGLSKMVEMFVHRAVERAKANGRKTVRAVDF
ncbi:MAG: hypothetical protein HYW50_02485 [Candidatus Diapherotrites archaeon]|nr:hypothetical protein [Candidatus Diapherotrites archaeon]